MFHGGNAHAVPDERRAEHGVADIARLSADLRYRIEVRATEYDAGVGRRWREREEYLFARVQTDPRRPDRVF